MLLTCSSRYCYNIVLYTVIIIVLVMLFVVVYVAALIVVVVVVVVVAVVVSPIVIVVVCRMRCCHCCHHRSRCGSCIVVVVCELLILTFIAKYRSLFRSFFQPLVHYFDLLFLRSFVPWSVPQSLTTSLRSLSPFKFPFSQALINCSFRYVSILRLCFSVGLHDPR